MEISDRSIYTKRHVVWYFENVLAENWVRKTRGGDPMLTIDEEYALKTAIESIDALGLIEEELNKHKDDFETKDSSYCNGFYDCCEIFKVSLLRQKKAEYQKKRESYNPFADKLEQIEKEIKSINPELLSDENVAVFYQCVMQIIETHKENF